MEFGYAEPAEWPMASALAMLAGASMILGRHAALAAGVAEALASGSALRLLGRLARPWLASAALLALTAAFPASPLVLMLRGLARPDLELEMARADGYYEHLIGPQQCRCEHGPSAPPPGLTSFAASGLVVEVPDYRHKVLRPGLDARWNGTRFRTDDLGHRGPPIGRPKPPRTFRVAVLGSSNTMGHGVEDEQGYARLLERLLAGGAGPGRRVEVVNLAVSGDSPTQRLLRLRDDVPGLEPDWILSDVTALDYSLEEQHLRWALAHGVRAPFDFVREALGRSGVVADDSHDEFHEKFRGELKPLVDRAFAGWAAEARRIGAPITVVILPRADSKTPSPGLFRLFRESAGRHALRLCDLSDAFDRLELDEYRIGPWDAHPNALGHRLIAARLRDDLLADPEFLAGLDGTRPTR